MFQPASNSTLRVSMNQWADVAQHVRDKQMIVASLRGWASIAQGRLRLSALSQQCYQSPGLCRQMRPSPNPEGDIKKKHLGLSTGPCITDPKDPDRFDHGANCRSPVIRLPRRQSTEVRIDNHKGQSRNAAGRGSNDCLSFSDTQQRVPQSDDPETDEFRSIPTRHRGGVELGVTRRRLSNDPLVHANVVGIVKLTAAATVSRHITQATNNEQRSPARPRSVRKHKSKHNGPTTASRLVRAGRAGLGHPAASNGVVTAPPPISGVPSDPSLRNPGPHGVHHLSARPQQEGRGEFA